MSDETRSEFIQQVDNYNSKDMIEKRKRNREATEKRLRETLGQQMDKLKEEDQVQRLKLAAKANASTLKSIDISTERWRSYNWLCPESHNPRHFIIKNPATVHFRPRGLTHRVTNTQGVTHIVPAPGIYGCVVTLVVA